jgi:hypothetical protein
VKRRRLTVLDEDGNPLQLAPYRSVGALVVALASEIPGSRCDLDDPSKVEAPVGFRLGNVGVDEQRYRRRVV